MVNTLGPYALLWYLMYRSLTVSWWLLIPLAVLAGAFTVRIFIIFHDCGHGSYFRSRTANSVVGFITGMLKQAGTTAVRLEASGPGGKDTRDLTIVSGERKLALTPPLGWNSWNVWARAVDAEKHFLGQVFGNSRIVHHPVEEIDKGSPVLAEQKLEGLLVPAFHVQHQSDVGPSHNLHTLSNPCRV